MKRRFMGAVLAGLGVLFLVVAVGLPFYVGPAVTRLPNDLQACPTVDKPQPDGCLKPSVAEASNATFLDLSTGQIVQGNLRATTWVVPQAKVTADEQKALTRAATASDLPLAIAGALPGGLDRRARRVMYLRGRWARRAQPLCRREGAAVPGHVPRRETRPRPDLSRH